MVINLNEKAILFFPENHNFIRGNPQYYCGNPQLCSVFYECNEIKNLLLLKALEELLQINYSYISKRICEIIITLFQEC